jgi:hypothetical protein
MQPTRSSAQGVVRYKKWNRKKAPDGLPDWWPAMVALTRGLKLAEQKAETARRRRDLMCWLAVRHRGVSIRWVAGRTGLASTTVQRAVEAMDLWVAQRGWSPRDVERDLALGIRARMTRERLARDERGAEIMGTWSAPPPPL